MALSTPRSKTPMTGHWRGSPPGGSRQMLDNMGSSVKLTNKLTSTATVTVMPKG